MTGSTHALGGITAAALVIAATHPTIEHAALGVVVGFCAGLLPDWFQPNFPGVKFGWEAHRGSFHQLWAQLLMWHALQQYGVEWYALAGMVSHSILDMPTGGGVMYLWPLPIWFRLPRSIRARNGGAFETLARAALVVAPVVVAMGMIAR